MRLIDADAIRFEYGGLARIPHYDAQGIAEYFAEQIKQMPTIEPKKGKWIHHPEIGWGETWLCDQCGEKTVSTVMGKPRANFCPNCGADMREGEADE